MNLLKPNQTPNPKRVKSICTAHDQQWIDDYAWLRADNWQDSIADPSKLPKPIADYLNAENDYFKQATANLKPLCAQLIAEMRGRMAPNEDEVPIPDGPYKYFDRYREDEEHELYMRTDHAGGNEEILFDVNEEASRFEYFEIGFMHQSPDHSMLLWTCDTSGSEFYTLYIRDLATGTDKGYTIENVDSVTWADNETLFYTRLNNSHRAQQVYKHTIGTEPETDTLVFQEKDERFYCGVDSSLSGEYIFIHTSMNDQDEIWFIPTSDLDAAPVVVQPRLEGLEYGIEHQGNRFILATNAGGATDFKLVETPITASTMDHWKDIVPYQQGRMIDDFVVFEDWLIWLEMVDALPQIATMDKLGNIERLSFNEQAYSLGLYSGHEYHTNSLLYDYSSPTTPDQTHIINLQNKDSALIKQTQIPSGHNSDDYITKRILVESHDGVDVPVTLLYHKDTALDGTAPAMLYGYGSYGYSSGAGFRHERLAIVDRGFVFAIAHVRGGQEKGRAWYEAAKLDCKVNSFHDFNAVGEALIEKNICASGKLVSIGGSAGGLLVGASMNMKPELFAGVIALVPFVDVLNTMLDSSLPGTPGEFTQWGNPIDSEQAFNTIRSYSPYENVQARDYPALYVSAGVSDPRVTYWEPAKWVAKLRATKTDDNLILLKTNMSSGHFGKTGRFASLDDDAQSYAFAIAVTS